MMLKLWFFVLFSVVQIETVFPFVFPDDDYFKQQKPTPTPRYPNNIRPQNLISLPTQSTNNNDKAEVFYSCMATCPKTTEYDPICGTNRESYPNRSTFRCARRCGVDVRMVRMGRCSPVV